MTQTYEAWRITYQSSEQAARAAFERMMELEQGKCLHQIAEPAAVHPDDVAVDALAALMKAKLAKQRGKGYSGWDTDCTQQHLSNLLRGHVDKGDPVDVANFCAFLLARGEGIAAAPQAVQPAVPDDIDLPDVEDMAHPAEGVPAQVKALQDAEARLTLLIERDAHKLLDVVARDACRAALAATQPAQAVIDGGTPGPWRVRKRTNDAGEVLDCFVTAPDCQGRAYDAHILGDDYDNVALKLADAELIVAAVNAYRATQPAAQGLDADMFWDADEPESCQTSINNVVVEADSYRGLKVGDTVTIQRAVKLPDLEVRITMAPDSEGNGDLEWEELAAQAKQGGQANG